MTREDTIYMDTMKRAALRETATDKALLGLATLYGVLVAAMFAVGYRGAIVWAGVYVVAVLAWAFLGYRWNLDSLRRRADWAREQHERDLRMERLAQEADIIRAGGEEAEVIRARWDLERQERDQREREARQARIAAYEAQKLSA